MKSTCIICNQENKGRGHYTFRYLDETVVLCGHHAQIVMKFIKHKNQILEKGCTKCDYLLELFERIDNPTKRDYWIMTEIFMYMHGNKDFCDAVKSKIKEVK